MIIDTFTTAERTRGDYEPAVSLDIEVGKTNALITYTANANALENDDRLLYHRILEANHDAVLANPELDDMYEYFTADNCYEFEIWTVINSDTTDPTPYEYSFNWSGMEPGTDYIYYYMTINGNGVCSEFKTLNFTTLVNEGGANPAFTIEINPESIKANDYYVNQYGGSGTITPNEDVVSYLYAFIDETAVESYGTDADDEDELHLEMYSQLISQGIPATDIAYNEGYTFSKYDRVWLMAQGQGANGVESTLSYVEMTVDGTISEQVDVDISKFTSSSVAAKSSSSDVESALYNSRNIKRATTQSAFDKDILRAKSSIYHIEKQAQKQSKKVINGAELRAAGIPYYSMKEMTLKILGQEVK